MTLYAFDGTGDKWEINSEISETAKTKKDRFLTNVVMFLKHYNTKNPNNWYYYSGVGTNGRLIGFIFGGFFGIGASGRIRKAFTDLKKEFAKGNEEIVIVGYSRGAATARMFLDKVAKEYHKINDKNGKPLSEAPKIKFVGLFDTVASFGLPVGDYEFSFQKHIPHNVENTIHAMALQERSTGFDIDRAYGNNVLEVWFNGGHGDVGGGSSLESGIKNTTRHNISLSFMLKKALACGVNIDVPDLTRNPQSPITYGGPLNRQYDFSREVLHDDVIHYTVFSHNDFNLLTDGRGKRLPIREHAVVEEIFNENEFSHTVKLQLTPEMLNKFNNAEDIYKLIRDNITESA